MSRGYSRIIIVGNLGGDPEMRFTPSGVQVTNFSVAVNRRRRGSDGNFQDETDWYRVSVWRRLAETADQYLSKGMKVLVDGQLQLRSYVDQSGTERTSLEINADNFLMLNTREESEAIRASEGSSSGPGDYQGNQGGGDSGNVDTFDDEDMDDVPF